MSKSYGTTTPTNADATTTMASTPTRISSEAGNSGNGESSTLLDHGDSVDHVGTAVDLPEGHASLFSAAGNLTNTIIGSGMFVSCAC
jgi:hypothetical protein